MTFINVPVSVTYRQQFNILVPHRIKCNDKAGNPTRISSSVATLEGAMATRVHEQLLEDGLRHTKDSVIDFMSGAVGATLSVYVGQPLDTVKVKLQTFPALYSGMTQCFVNTFRKDGIRGLYAGTIPALAANIAENSILFAGYGLCQKGVAYVSGTEKIESLSTLQNATSGFFAAFFSSLALCPTELIKCRLQALREVADAHNTAVTRVSPWRLTHSILRQDGIPGLFRGFTPTVAREMPGYFFFFGAYEATRIMLTPPGKTKEEIGPLRTVVCGGTAGIIFWVCIFPADVVKSRIQVSGSTDPMLRVMSHIVRTEGFRAFYNGLGPTVIRTFPASGALFLAYEFTKKYLHQLAD